MAKINKMKIDQRVRKTPMNSNWFNNIAKSMGFAANDIVKELIPNTSDFLEYNAQSSIEMIQDMRRNTGSRNNLTKQISNIPQISIGKDMLKNALDDIKSGKIYNNDRAMESNDFDDMDFGFDLFDDGDGIKFEEEVSEDDGTVTVNRNTVNNLVNTLPLAKSMAANTEMTISAMTAVAEQNLAIESEKMMFNHKSTSSILGGLSAINDNISTLVKFHGDSTSRYYAASIKYYEESLNELKAMQKASIKASENNGADGHVSNIFDNLYTYNGGLKVNKYVNTIKKNLADIRDENAMLASISDAFNDLDTMKSIAKNPLGAFTKMGMKSLIPMVTKTAVKALDESLSGILPAVIAKINDLEDNDNPILDYVYKVFGAKNKLSYSVDLGEYEKGGIPWDGEAKKALVEVLPTYMRRIEAAITGQQERIFDYTTGKFSSIDEVQKRYKQGLHEVETSGYSEVKLQLREFMTSLNASADAIKQFDKDVTEYLSAVTKKGSMINPFIRKGSDGFDIDELMDEGFFDGDESRIKIFRNAMKSLTTKQLSSLASSFIYDSRANTQQYMDEIRKNPNISGFNVINNGSVIDAYGKKIYDPAKSKGVFGNGTDKFGLSQLDYLRDIRSVLVNGIRVYPTGSVKKSGVNPNEAIYKRMMNESVIASSIEPNFNTFSSSGISIDEISNLSDDELTEMANKIKNQGKSIKGKEPKSKVGKFINKKMSVVNSYVEKATNAIDDGIYKILFGSQLDGELSYEEMMEKANKIYSDAKNGEGTLGSIIGFVQDTVKGVGSYFTGQDYVNSNGKLVKGDEDAVFKKMKRFFSNSVNSLFGDKTDGSDKGLLGRFSEDFMDGYKQFKRTLFGEKGMTDKEKNETLSQLTATVKKRLPKAIGSGLLGAGVKTLFASKMGLLGSVLLPGGPLGAALTGTAVGFLSQSDTFKNWLFGEKDMSGQRMGGFVPKSLVNMIQEHGGSVKTGAIIGGVTGLLPSFFLPGGPITGAVMGVGAGLLTKSDTFQEFLFGEDFKNKDNRKLMNGAFGKLFKKTLGSEGKKINPKLAAFLGTTGAGIGVAQGIGLLPSFLLPGGPITGAILGLAGGITASSDKFQEFLFGETDIDGKRYGGLMTKFTNWFDTTVVSPFKIKATEINDSIYEFVQNKMVSPFLHAFDPITQAFKFAVDDAKNAMSNTWHRITDGVIGAFNDNVVKPFGESLERYVVDPLKKSFNTVLKLVGKGLGALVSSPFKLLSKVGDMADAFNARHVLREDRKKRISEKGLIRGFFISKSKKQELLDQALPYRREREAREQQRKEELQAKLDERKAKRDEMIAQYNEDREFGRKSNWKYASKKQKEQREKDLKNKVEWMNQRNLEEIRDNGDEAVKKLTGIQELINKMPSYEDKKLEVLNSMKKSIIETLNKLIDRGYDGGENNKGIISALRSKLEDDGQSHADGLDNVPNDGYIAQLHEGEMVVPKKGAGVLRNFLGKKPSGSGKNGIVQKLFGDKDDKDDNGIIGSMFKRMTASDKSDRADNSLYLSREEQSRMKEMLDIQRYEQVSRKDVDFIQNQREQEKKEKEDKLFKTQLLESIQGGTAETKKGNSFWEKLFGSDGLLGKFFGGGLASLLSKLGLGGGLSGLGTVAGAIAGGTILNYINEKNEEAKENGSSLFDTMGGYGDVGQKNAEGYYAHDNTGDNLIKTTVRNFIPGAYNKVVKPTVEAGKTVHSGVKKGVTGIKNGVKNATTAFNNYVNPSITRTGKTVLGDTYTATTKLDRKGLQKPLGAASDFTKKLATNAKDGISLMINTCKTALTKLESAVAKKIPGVKGLTSSVDDIFKKLLASSDTIWKKFGSKIQLYVIDGAADFIPIVGQVTEAAMTVWDIGTGLTAGNAGNLFQVQTNEIDLNMRLITSAMQGVCKFSWFSIIWLINEICSSMYDFSFLTHLARTIYTLVPKFSGKKVDMSNDLTDDDIKNAKSIEDLITAAGGDPSQFKGKKLSDLKSSDLTGISAVELQEIKRYQYNKENNTQMDRQGFADETSKTVGQKILGSKTMKNLKGTFSKSSARGHLGLNKDAKMTFGERANFAMKKTGVNIYNSVAKLFGKEQIDDNEWFKTKDYDENGKKVKKGTGTLTYAQAREKKNQNKVDKANAEINKRLKNQPKSGIGKFFNNMMIGYQKGVRERARKRIGTKSTKKADPKAKKKQTQELKNWDKNAVDSSTLDVNQKYEEALLEAYGFGESLGKGDDEPVKTQAKKAIAKPNKKSKSVKSVARAEKSAENAASQVNKQLTTMFNKVATNTKRTTSNMTKAMTKGNTLLTKGYNDQQKSITKSAKDLSKKLDKETEKNDKDMEKGSKNLFSSAGNLFSSLKDKVEDTVSNIKNIKVDKVSAITPTFEISSPIDFMKDLFSDIFDKSKKKENKEKKKNTDNNAGSSGVTRSERRELARLNVPKQTATNDHFITPSTTTNTTTNSTSNKFVFYNQGDQRWGDKTLIGGKTIKDAGCGPTSLAMAISQMTGEMVTPDVIAQLGAKHLPGYSAYSLFPTIANKFSMNYEEGKNNKDANFIINRLKKGLPVLLSGQSNGKGTPFTKEGHVVTATQVKGDSVFIQDPRGKEYSKFYKMQDIMSGLKKSMVLSPSIRTKYAGIPSAGKLSDVNTKKYRSFAVNPLGIYGDGPSIFEEGDAGKAGAQVKVADRVLSYMRAFLNQKSKFAYSQPLRNEINVNKSHADCSSFVGHVLTVAGDTPVSGTSQSMWDGVGTRVENPQIGDIVCQQGHVGLYSGNGKYIHMSSPKSGIKESDVMAKGNKPHRGYKRVLKDPNAMVDAVIKGGNSLLGTVTATESGLPIEGGAGATTGTSTTGESAELLGVFGKMNNLSQNMVASIFNGKQVDLNGSTTSSTDTTATSPTASINGKTVNALFTAYYPDNSRLQGGFFDAHGNRLDPSKNTCAAPKEVPLGTKIQISGTGTEKDGQIYTVNDRGGAIKVRGDEYQFDLLMKDHASTYGWGRKKGQAIIGDSTSAGMGESDRPYMIDGFELPNNLKSKSLGKSPATATSAESYSGSGIPDSMNGWAYYKQSDPRWNTQSIGGSTVGRAGCGPTSHAMMLTTMFGQKITPDVMTKWAYDRKGWTRDGMMWSMPGIVAKEFGLSLSEQFSGKSNSTLDAIKSEIRSGRPVIMSGRGQSKNSASPFSTGGHIVLGVGVDGNNNIIINDSRGPQMTKAYTDEGLRIGQGLRAAWSFAQTPSSAIPTSIQTAGNFAAGSYSGSDGTAAAETPDMFGVFSKMSNLSQNMVASIFNGKQVDLFGTTSSSDATTSGDITNLTGNGVAEQIYNFARQKGCTPQAASGLVGNAECESNFNPAAVNSIGASGLFQWLGGRKSKLQQRASQAGKDWTDVASQLNFLWWELEGGEPTTQALLNKYVGGLEGFKNLTDPYKAGFEFGRCFERGGYNDKRGKKATEWYNKFSSLGKGEGDEKDKFDKIIRVKKEKPKKKMPEGIGMPSGGSAGKGGDGKTHIITPAVDKHAKPLTEIGKVKKGVIKAGLGKGQDQVQQKLRKASANILQNMQGAIKKNRTTNVQSNDQLSSAYLEAMAGVLDELKDINTNTAITAENTSKIKVYSANEPINNSTAGVQNNNNTKANRGAANSNTGYELARNIAGFATK